MTIVRVGATKKYSDGWEAAFGRGKKTVGAAKSVAKKAGGKKTAKKAPAKASAKKKSAKKGRRK